MDRDRGAASNRISALGVHALAAGVIVYALGGVTSILISRALGPTGRGIYVLPVTLVTIVATLVMMGMHSAQFRLWSHKVDDADAFITAGAVLSMILGTAGIALAWGIFVWGQDRWFVGVEPVQVLIILPVLPFIIHSRLQHAVLVFASELRYANRANVIGAVAQMSGTATLFVLGALTVEPVLVFYVASMVVPWAVMHVRLRRVGRIRRPLPLSLMASYLRLGVRMGPAGLFQYINLRVDVFLIARYLGAAGVGIYSVAVVISELMWLVTNAVASSVSERQANAGPDEAIDVTARAIRMNLALAVVIGTGVAAASPVLIPLLYGSAFASAVPIVWVLLVASAAISVWRPCSSMLARFGSPSSLPMIAATAALVNVVGNLLLIPRMGLVGAGLASVLSYGTASGMAISVLRRATSLSFGQVVPRSKEFRALIRLVRDRSLSDLT